MLNDTSTDAMEVPRPTLKGQKVGGDPIPAHSHPFPQIPGTVLPLISLGNNPAGKN